MSTAESTAANREDTALRRHTAVAAAIDRMRRIETEDGVSWDSLDRVKQVMIELTADASLFPVEDFPLGPGETSKQYILSRDGDGRFALYMSVSSEGRETPPHNHTTWAVIAGLKGQEHNQFYCRLDDGSEPGTGRIEKTERLVVVHGDGVTLMPDTVHSIYLEGEAPIMMLHMYGRALDLLDERVAFDMENGTTWKFGAGNVDDSQMVNRVTKGLP
jgi:predicted metal-dependent enzyme (double-stranded beta helix superfamily)